MATRLYGVGRGKNKPTDVAEGVGSAVAANSVELTVDLASSLSKKDVLMALDKIWMKIFKGSWPPA